MGHHISRPIVTFGDWLVTEYGVECRSRYHPIRKALIIEADYVPWDNYGANFDEAIRTAKSIHGAVSEEAKRTATTATERKRLLQALCPAPLRDDTICLDERKWIKGKYGWFWACKNYAQHSDCK